MKLLFSTLIGSFAFGYIFTLSTEFIRNGEPIVANKHLSEYSQILNDYCAEGITEYVGKEIVPNKSIPVVDYSTHNVTLPPFYNQIPMLKNSTCFYGDAFVEKSMCAFASN